MPALSHVYAKLETKWPCTPKEYPVLGKLADPKDILSFKLHHALGHLHKSVGKIEALLEKVDHGESEETLKQTEGLEQVGKSIVNVMQVAKTMEIDPDELEKWIEDFLETA